jgi:membrane-associated phospholipid phosphatase
VKIGNWTVLGVAILTLLPAPARAKDAIDIVADTLQFVVPGVGLGNTLVRRDWEGARQWALSGAVTGGVTLTLKYSIDATRPNGGGLSFPSGHTAAVAWGTAFLHRRYGWKWALPAYAATGFVMWARVENDHHHVRDVLAGAAIGLLSGGLLTRRYEIAGQPVSVSPLPISRGYGLQFAGVW